MRTIFTRIGKFFAGVAITAALLAGGSTPALAQTPMTALSASTNFTLVNLGSLSGYPTTVLGSTGTQSTYGIVIIGGATGTITYCSGYVGFDQWWGGAYGVPTGSCVVSGKLPSTPVSNWSYTILGSMISFLNQQSGAIFRCGGVTDLNYQATVPHSSCQSLGDATK